MSEPLPLWPSAKPCVRSGFCCRKAPCPFGEKAKDHNGCKHLVEEPDGRTLCGRYEYILSLPQEQWAMAPAFGAGCCMSLFNEDRDRIIREHGYG